MILAHSMPAVSSGVITLGGNISGRKIGTASATLTAGSNGTVTGVAVNGSVTWSPQNYYTPTTAGIGSSYWVRATLQSGSTPSGAALGSWLQLSSDRSWTITESAGSIKTSSLLIEVSSNSGGTAVIASGTYNLSALGGA